MKLEKIIKEQSLKTGKKELDLRKQIVSLLSGSLVKGSKYNNLSKIKNKDVKTLTLDQFRGVSEILRLNNKQKLELLNFK
jgi:hypothetical protein